MTVYLTDDRQVTLSAEQAYRAGLRRGISLADDELARLIDEDCEIRAKEAALRLLGTRARSRAELTRRLAGKGFRTGTIDACIERLAASGLIDDAEFAGAFVRDRIRLRPRGIAGLRADLQVRGVDEETASAAIQREMDVASTSELDLARIAARRFRSKAGEAPHATLRRLHGYLGRRGFSAETIAGMLAEHRSTLAGTDARTRSAAE